MKGPTELEIAGRRLLGGRSGGDASRFDPGLLAAGAITGRMTNRLTIASEQHFSAREVVVTLARFPAVLHVRVHA